jgi:ribosomal protein S18 acetylase RimI-like enzyme
VSMASQNALMGWGPYVAAESAEAEGSPFSKRASAQPVFADWITRLGVPQVHVDRSEYADDLRNTQAVNAMWENTPGSPWNFRENHPWRAAVADVLNSDAAQKLLFASNFLTPGVKAPMPAPSAPAPQPQGIRAYHGISMPEKMSNLESLDRALLAAQEQRRPLVDGYDVVSTPSVGRVNYEVVPTGKPLYAPDGSPNGIGTFQAKPAQRMDVPGVEVTNARLHSDQRRRGIGTAVYDTIGKDFAEHGGVWPSPTDQLSDTAKAFWGKRLRDQPEIAQALGIREILRRYGLAGLMAGGAAASARSSQDTQ